MIKSVKEIASSSNIPAPIFRFRNYDRGQTYYNDGQIIDFVTDGENLYVPVVDSTPNLDELRCAHDRNRGANEIVIERGVVATKDSPKEDDNFMLLVSRGPQGIQGIQGKPGKDGKTPSVFARFDGKQMVFYTVEDVDGVPTKRRIAATNDLTGPAWKPELIDDTIVWRKTKDDEAPRSIPLNELRANATPILLRVNSDNTKREDETSGPANYIQWKYEGQPYWNNLISISELMNLTLAGVTIFPVQNPETGKTEYHLGHKEVTKATYDSTPEGKQIITDVELGEVLFDAGPIPFPEYNYEYDIAYLKAENCDRIREIRAIQLELPKFVRSVNNNFPDEDGNVELEIPNPNDYIKKSDLKFEVREEENGRYLYVSMDNGTSWTKVMEATCACTHEDTPTVIPVTSVTLNCPDSPLTVGTNRTLSYTINPSNATNKNVTFNSSDTSIATVTNAGVVTPKAAGTTTITVTTVDGGKTSSCTITVNNPAPIEPTGVAIDNCAGGATVSTTKQLTYRVLPTNASDKSVTFTSSNINVATVSNTGLVTAVAAGTAVITISTWNNKTATCTVTVEEAEPNYYTLTVIGNGAESITVNGDNYEEPMSIEEGTRVIISASRDGFTPSYSENNFNMTKDTSVNITWTEVQPDDKPVTSVTIGDKPTNNTITWDCSNNQTYTLSATVAPEDATRPEVTWSSSDETVATINSTGVITVVGPGTTTITATADNKSDDFELTINRPDVTSISLNKPSVNLNVGGTETLTATINPSCADGTVTWSSSNTSIATVNNGTITAKAAGTATITAKIGNDGPSADCNVTVNTGTISVTGVQINDCVGTMSVGDEASLAATVYPNNATNKNVTWSSSNSSIATVDSTGKVNALQAGQVTISVTTIDGNKTDSCTISITERLTEYRVTVRNETGENDITCEVGFTGGNYEGGSNNLTVGDDTTVITTVRTGSLTVSPKTSVSEGILALVYGDTANNEYWNITTNHSVPLSDIISAAGNNCTLSVQVISDEVTPIECLGSNFSVSLADGQPLKVGERYFIVKNNAVSGVTYQYTSSNTNKVTVDQDGSVLAKNVASLGDRVKITVTAQKAGCETVTKEIDPIIITYPNVTIVNTTSATFDITVTGNLSSPDYVIGPGGSETVEPLSPSIGIKSSDSTNPTEGWYITYGRDGISNRLPTTGSYLPSADYRTIAIDQWGSGYIININTATLS